MTFDGRYPSMENSFQSKTFFVVGNPLMEMVLLWKMIILGRLVKRINRGTDVQLIFEASKSFAEKRQGGVEYRSNFEEENILVYI